MRLRDNDIGLLYDRTTGEGFDRAQRIAVPRPAAYRPAMPESDWTPPREFPSLGGVRRIAIDVETCDVDLKKLGPGVRRGGYIVGLAIGIDGGPRTYFPVRHEGGGNCEMDVLGWARADLNAYRGEIVGTRLDYDLDFLAEEGITFPNVAVYHDISVAEPLLDEWRFSYSLDALSKDYLGEGKDETLLDQAAAAAGLADSKTDLWRLPAKFVGPYAEADVDRPLRILPLQQERLRKEGLEKVYDIERRLIPVLLAMRRKGVRVDLQRAEEVKWQLETKRTELTARLKHLAGSSAEWMAPASFVAALRERGINPPLTPKTEQPSVNKYFLESHKQDELCATILQGRRINTLINTFMEGHIFGHHINGRIHAQFIQLKRDADGGGEEGTIGRIASQNPNLQQIPKRNKEFAPLIRSIFIPEDGERWVRLDESQVEYRFLVHYARGIGAELAREKYRNDPTTDFHDYCAELAHVKGGERTWIKNLNFAKNYGAQDKKIAMLLNCSIEDARAFIRRHEDALPFTVTTFNSAKFWADKRGFVETIMGRKCRFPFWEPAGYGARKPGLKYDAALEAYGPHLQRSETYTALNKKMQLSSADLIKKAMVDAWEAGLPLPLLSVHDEIDLSTTDEAAVAEWRRIMETCITLSVPLICDVEQGDSWGTCA